ncbi:hypothetical protein LAJ19_16125 (plasmid) [Deinococcus taeanensis]|nr:hypothetical protein LAJ19_16125 [Deinococcus taeanensis]
MSHRDDPARRQGPGAGRHRGVTLEGVHGPKVHLFGQRFSHADPLVKHIERQVRFGQLQGDRQVLEDEPVGPAVCETKDGR